MWAKVREENNVSMKGKIYSISHHVGSPTKHQEDPHIEIVTRSFLCSRFLRPSRNPSPLRLGQLRPTEHSAMINFAKYSGKYETIFRISN
jgi:hypothetical protein